MSFGQCLREFRLGVLKVGFDLFQPVAADAQRLHFGFADPFSGAGIFGFHRSLLTLELGFLPLQLADPVHRSKALLGDLLQAIELLADQPLLLDERCTLLGVARLLLHELRSALTQHRLLCRNRTAARMHLRALQIHHLVRDDAVVRAQCRKLRGRGELVLSGPFREQARALCQQCQIVTGERTFRRFELGGRKLDQYIAGLDVLAFANVDRSDDSTVLMLDGLAIAEHCNLACGIHSRVKRDKRRPAEEDDEEGDGYCPFPSALRGSDLRPPCEAAS